MLRCEAALRAVLVDGDGEILWQGRKRRLATRAQYEAMADATGVVRRRAATGRLVSAMRAMTSRGSGGHTDVDQMRLVCRRHHREAA